MIVIFVFLYFLNKLRVGYFCGCIVDWDYRFECIIGVLLFIFCKWINFIFIVVFVILFIFIINVFMFRLFVLLVKWVRINVMNLLKSKKF